MDINGNRLIRYMMKSVKSIFLKSTLFILVFFIHTVSGVVKSFLVPPII